MIKFLFKGIIRDRQRSLFPIITVALGVMLCCIFFCYSDGFVLDAISSTAKLDTGHVKIMTKEYAEFAHQVPNDLAIINSSKLIDELEKEYSINWVSRIKFGGLLDVPDEHGETLYQGPVIGLAIDMFNSKSSEIERLSLKKSIIKGKLPSKRNEVLLSKIFADKLKLGIGDKVTLIGATSTGSMAVHNFIISGVTKFGIYAFDRNLMIADITDMRYALDMEDSTGEILGYFTSGVYNKQKANTIHEKFTKTFKTNTNNKLTLATLWMQNNLGKYLDDMMAQKSFILFIIIILMFVVLWNTGLIAGIRRYGEIGVRLAIGESKAEVYKSMILESVLVGFIGSVLGCAVGVAFSYYLQVVGIDIGEMLKDSKFTLATVIRVQISLKSILMSFIPGMIAIILGTIVSGIGIFKRQTSSLFKELEV